MMKKHHRLRIPEDQHSKTQSDMNTSRGAENTKFQNKNEKSA
jgi:hypothetical protein